MVALISSSRNKSDATNTDSRNGNDLKWNGKKKAESTKVLVAQCLVGEEEPLEYMRLSLPVPCQKQHICYHFLIFFSTSSVFFRNIYH